MKRKELTKTFVMISNCKKSFGLPGLYESISALSGLNNLLTLEVLITSTAIRVQPFDLSFRENNFQDKCALNLHIF